MEAIVDRELAIWRKRRAIAAGAPGADFLLRRAALELGERLDAVERRFARAAALFCRTDAAEAALVASGKADAILRIEAHCDLLSGRSGLVAETETLPLEPGSLDLVVSLLALHEFDDLPGLMIQVRRALRPDGLFLGCFPGAGTLAELRDALLRAETDIHGGASPRVLPFADLRDVGALLQRAGFALPVTDIEPVVVRYDTMFGLMRDLRAMGETSALAARSRRPARRALFARAAEIYADRFADRDGRVRATFNLVWFSGWAPAPSQQQPLKPGSAKARLADALAALDPGPDAPS